MSLKHHEALRLFTDASKRYPASVTAQSAALALETKRNRRIPTLLRLMRYDSDAIETIAKTAENVHAHTTNTRAPTVVDRDIVRGILDAEIEWIDRLTRLRRHQIEHILALYATRTTDKEYESLVEATYFPEK